MIKIYYPINTVDIMTLRNPYLRTIIQGVQSIDKDTVVSLGTDLFWQNDCENYEIIHIMWPEDLLVNGKTANEVENRLKSLKKNDVKIVTTCHNLHSHVPKSNDHNIIYDIVYENSDLIIHLGSFSYGILKEKYPCVYQSIIPHHVYDTVYPSLVGKKESCKALGISEKNNYILCLGAFRNEQEKELACKVADNLKDGYFLMAPTFIERVERRYIIKYISFLWYIFMMKLKHPRLIIRGTPVSDKEIPYYYGASLLTLIQRLEILNSGNLPLAYYMGKTVVGPNTGNVANIIKDTGNFVFDVNNIQNAVDTVNKALESDCAIIGKKNRVLALSEWTTAAISAKVVSEYKKLITSK